MWGIPIEIISGLGSYLLSAWTSINSAKQEREESRHKHDMALMAAQSGANLEWLKAQNDLVKIDPHFSITRRFIALFIVVIVFGAALLLPTLAKDIPWILPIVETTDGFLGFFETTEESFTTITGILYLDWMGSAVMSIVGFYFGGKAGKQ